MAPGVIQFHILHGELFFFSCAAQPSNGLGRYPKRTAKSRNSQM